MVLLPCKAHRRRTSGSTACRATLATSIVLVPFAVKQMEACGRIQARIRMVALINLLRPYDLA